MEQTQSHLGFPPETLAVFITLAVVALLIDLFAHRSDKPIGLKSAAIWSIFWVLISLGFAGYLYIHHNAEVATLFITGYALEKILSVDNLFVIMAIFAWFKIPDMYRHRILYLGVIGAIIFRGIFVAIGTGLLALGPWVEMVFAIIVGWTAIMMLKSKDDEEEIKDYSDHLANRLIRRIFPVFPKIVGHKFFLSSKQVSEELLKPENHNLRINVKKGTLYATPLLLCVAVVELSDVMFAFDSVPAIIAVSREPLIVYSAMMFAILGLRTLYFVLEALRQYLVHLEKAVVFLLFFIAFKLGFNAVNHIWHLGYEIKPTISLYVVLVVLALGILASFVFPEKKEQDKE
ncbi:TerC/Alx family metal homeostasis membrane protein [Entomomonas sp. E2T0]|uniref:TerC/Alx family metal homeostasis membrane protein n=1 Tax=Entomomonas sp. E2T0 TaxID=2930213 RepID=UPI0022281C31|nr:TerC/Alx family metal homeostasis membrane protein [Entomomonas sp. E2T0]UYZ85093.1 TerC/Alx family metal homeostasis membrane protein [Entomomonas sp. E2T0]